MINIKTGVKIEGMRPEILLALVIANDVFRKYGVDCIITEVTGGEHMHQSLHYAGLAVDLRSKHIDNHTKPFVLKDLQMILGQNYDVLLEGLGTPNEHFHVEFDPE